MRNLRMPAVSVAALAAGRPACIIGSVRNDDGIDNATASRLGRLTAEVKNEVTKIRVEQATKIEKQATKIEKLADKLEMLETRNADLEKIAASRGGFRARVAAASSTFAEALDHEAVRNAVKSFESHGRTRFTVQAAILTGAPSGPAPRRDYSPGIVEPVRRAIRVRDLMTVTPTSEGAVEYTRESGFTNGAAVVTEGEQKPETTITFDIITATPATIAHWTQASKQVLADVRRLQSFLDTRMRYGVQLEEDAQLLFGSGVGLNLSGLTVDATAFSAPAGISLTTQADYVGAAIAQLRAIDHEPDGVVMHPNDWQKILQEKGSDGHYIVPGGPFSTTEPMLFKKPIALTTAMTEDSFLVGQFAVGAEIFEREETVVEISTEDRDNFVKNLVTVRAEERIILATYQPEAFVFGDFGLVTG